MKAFILQNEIPQNMHIMSRNEQIKKIPLYNYKFRIPIYTFIY